MYFNKVSLTLKMSSVEIIAFSAQPSEQNKVELHTWPIVPWMYEANAKAVMVGLSSSSQSNSSDASLHFSSSKAIDYQVMQVSAVIFKILRRKLRRSKHAYYKKFTIDASHTKTWDAPRGKTNRALSFIELSDFVPSPIYVILCNNTSNFFCGNVIKTVFQRISDAKQKNAKLTVNKMWQIVHDTFDIDKTFEFQFNDTFAIKSQPKREFNEEDAAMNDDIDEFEVVPQYEVEYFDRGTREKEYKKFLKREYDSTVEYDQNSFKYFQQKLIKNKLSIRDLVKASTNIIPLSKLVKRKPDICPPEIKTMIEKVKKYFDDKSSEYKCCICTERFQDSMLSECYHMSMCRGCADTNRRCYGRYACPICNKHSQFIINDLDL